MTINKTSPTSYRNMKRQTMEVTIYRFLVVHEAILFAGISIPPPFFLFDMLLAIGGGLGT
jgi:hypothetical protein